MAVLSNTQRYRALLQQVRATRGSVCEACHAPALHVHHVIPILRTGLNDALAYEPANVLLLCEDCHLLMHPGIRRTDWLLIRRLRGRALSA